MNLKAMRQNGSGSEEAMPVIAHNGAFVPHPSTGEILSGEGYADEEDQRHLRDGFGREDK